MFNKSFLINKTVKSLLKKEFQVFITHGCFDIAARKEFLMLIKGLINIDGLSEDHALSLRTISYFVSAYPLIVSLKTNKGLLNDEIIYTRFQVPVVTQKMFENIIQEEAVPVVQSAKGRHTIAIDTAALRERRRQLKLTLEELSDSIGVSKKALYEIESSRVNPTEETVKRLELVLKVNLKKPYELKVSERTYLKPEYSFQKNVSKEFSRIGIDNSPVYSAPFEIIGREKFSLITNLSENETEIKKEAGSFKSLSTIFLSQGIFVAKKSKEKATEGVPIVLESELPEIESYREFSKLIEERV